MTLRQQSSVVDSADDRRGDSPAVAFRRGRIASRALHGAAGVSLVGTLVALVILGVLAYVSISFLTAPSALIPTAANSTPASPSPTPTTGTPLSSVLSLAVVTACRADFTMVQTALNNYRAVVGGMPSEGSAWATARLSGGPFLQSWPTGNGAYSITWNGTNLIVTPRTGPVSIGNPGTPTPPTGCYAAG